MKGAGVVLALFLLATGGAAAGPLDQLLEEVKEARRQEAELDRRREAEFRAARDRQARLLAEARARLEAEQARSEALRARFDENEKRLAELEETLQRRQGDLGELFGVVRQVAGDVAGVLDTSLVAAQYPGRGEALLEMSRQKALPTIPELENLWLQMLHEMTESGKVVRFDDAVVEPDGSERRQEVVRVGVFDVVSGGRFLRYLPETDQLLVLPRQPARRYTEMARALQEAREGMVPMAVDPSRGAILQVLVQMPTLKERVEQGRTVGYVILGLGAFGLLLAFYRLLALGITSLRVRAQLARPDEPRPGNPLGRVLLAWKAHGDSDPEALERHIDEAVLKEVPRLQRGLSIIKILAVMAPLLGLLGTVTGMIETFQSITLFGTGDPKLMAGGISQALVTTVLGLVTAIPLIFLHALVASRSRALVQILEEQSAGIIARQVERRREAGC